MLGKSRGAQGLRMQTSPRLSVNDSLYKRPQRARAAAALATMADSDNAQRWCQLEALAAAEALTFHRLSHVAHPSADRPGL